MARRNDGKEKRAPLDAGNPRRITDARCAWNGMTDEQRSLFLEEIIGASREVSHGCVEYIVHATWEDEPDDEPETFGHARLTGQELYDHENPPMRDDPMAFER